MSIEALQHINIHCANADRTRDFYVRILGLLVGPRPPFASKGYWLYLHDQPVVHLVQKSPDGATGRSDTGALNHVAFAGRDLEATRVLLKENRITFREVIVPRDNTVQLFLHDPDGVQLELSFPEM